MTQQKIQQICKIANKCGGCQLLHSSYEETIKVKSEFTLECFKKANLSLKLDKIIKAEQPYCYRNKMIVAYQMQDRKLVCGFFASNSHKVVPLENCLMNTKVQNEIAQYIKEVMIKLHIQPYNENNHLGIIRYALIRESLVKQKIMVVIVTSVENFPKRNEFVKLLKNKFPEIITIVQNINARKTSIVLGDKERILYGKGFIEDELCGLKFQISSKSFYQINPLQTEKLYGVVKEYLNLDGNEIIIDAYCGVGTIGMTLANKAKMVYSVENNRQAVNYAINNAKANNIKNINFICQDATEYLIQKANRHEKCDCLILDPPRTGSTNDFLKSAIYIAPEKIVYVSCNVETLVRDLQLLMCKYEILKLSLVDMFCWTEHIEAVVLLKKKI